MADTVKFLKTPMKGDKMKIYKQRGFSYGIVESTTMQDYQKDVVGGVVTITQEMVNVKEVDEVFNINDIDFFFDENRVKFVKELEEVV